jgi:hypothetical protein
MLAGQHRGLGGLAGVLDERRKVALFASSLATVIRALDVLQVLITLARFGVRARSTAMMSYALTRWMSSQLRSCTKA